MSELSPEARALIDATRESDEPSVSDRDRVAARIGAQLGAAALAAAGAGSLTNPLAARAAAEANVSEAPLSSLAAAKASVGAGMVKVMLAAAVAGALSTTALWAFGRASTPTPAAEPSAARAGTPSIAQAAAESASRPSIAPAASIVVPAPDLAAKAQRPARARGETPTRKVAAAAAPEPEAAPTVEAGSLDRELILVGEAQRALRTGEAALALAKAREHLQAFPTGALREEAWAVQAIAQCALGEQGPEAMRTFEANAPGSVLLPRVRAACAQRAK